MKNNLFDFLSVERNNIICLIGLQDIPRVEQILQSQKKKNNDEHNKIIINNCFKIGTLIATLDYNNYYKIPPFQPFVECQVFEYEKLHNLFREVSQKYTLIRNEFYSQTIILNKLAEETTLKPSEVALLFNVSLTTAYKIINLASTNFEFIELCAINFIPIDYLNNLLKNYNYQILEYAINFTVNNKLSIYEIPAIIDEIYKQEQE
ncbi:MAG: hypothetical protein GYA50_08065 [Eubacteriaceae bacterium]|nr:hypothetical protein [Eubacteriaceae bacterium]